MISLNPSFATLTSLYTSYLLNFSVKLLNLPANGVIAGGQVRYSQTSFALKLWKLLGLLRRGGLIVTRLRLLNKF
jgi:hypothetical protein